MAFNTVQYTDSVFSISRGITLHSTPATGVYELLAPLNMVRGTRLGIFASRSSGICVDE